MSLFRKPKRNVRQRQVESDDENDQIEEEEISLSEIQSTIEKIKGSKKSSKSKKKDLNTSGTATDKNDGEKKSSTLLSFDDFDAEADDGEVFRVKKSSQSRRLMKQIRAERKERERQELNPDPSQPPLPPAPQIRPPPPPSISGGAEPVPDHDDIGIKFKSNLVINKIDEPPQPRTLAGYEAEALHAEEEDRSDESNSENDPLQEIIKRGDIPSAEAIYAARKRRQAARERGTNNIGPAPNSRGSGFISLGKEKEGSRGPSNHEDDDSEDDENKTIVMTGTRSDSDIKKETFKKVGEYHVEGDDDQHRWEEQQIRKAMKSSQRSELQRSMSPIEEMESHHLSPAPANGDQYVYDRTPPTSYNLAGIKDRIKTRITNITETYRAHSNEADRIVDEVMLSHNTIEEKEKMLPQTISRHQFYQDLRGYLADLVECFSEKLVQIRFVEEKYHKIKGDVHAKLVERRREDVRDQMRELSSATSKVQPINTDEEIFEENRRKKRITERDGRRRRRAQMRKKMAGQVPLHFDGMSSDDELSPYDQANIPKSRQDVENQLRSIMTDVVEDFSTLDGVLMRMEEWKKTDPSAYNEAYVSLCLHKMIAPLVTLELLFWNPLEDHSNIEEMAWHRRVAIYAHNLELNKEDNMFLSLVVEKVVLVKVLNVVKAAYDPLSTSQTTRLKDLITKLRNTYPTLTGSSKQVKELLTSVIDKFKASIDHDVYIPLGYTKANLEKPESGHSLFLNRQYWSSFKLFKNVLCWHGLISDKILIDLALSSLLYRYLIIGLGVVNSASIAHARESVTKTKQIVKAIPKEWKSKSELERFANYLKDSLGPLTGEGSLNELVKQLTELGFVDHANQLKKKFA